MGQRREAFAKRRRGAGYTQHGFAEALGVDFTTVGRWERGELTPHPYRLRSIAAALDISLEQLDALLSGPPTPAPAPAPDPLTPRRTM